MPPDSGPPSGQQAPTRLGQYQLLRKIAAGGMAELYVARHLGERRFDGPIVVKRMHPHLAEDPIFVEMFVDEARISSRLEHPNIVRVFDFEATREALFLVMEQIDGPDILSILRRCVRRRIPIPIELAVFIACHVLEALDYAHTLAVNGKPLKVVHRDISPGNVLVDRRGRVKLADFGIARAAERQHETATGTLKGKYRYMSPEQVEGGDLDARSDLFSLGIVLAEMLTGRRLFAAPNQLQVLLMVRNCDLSRLDAYGETIPMELQKIVRTALQRNREDRYSCAAEFRDALADWLANWKQRAGAAALASFLTELEEGDEPLVAAGDATSTIAVGDATLSGDTTRAERLAAKSAAAIGRQVFELGTMLPADDPMGARDDADQTEIDYAFVSIEMADSEVALGPGGARDSRLEQSVPRDDLPISGDLSRILVMDLLVAIAAQKRTGGLRLVRGRAKKEAYFVNGHPIFVRSNLGGERFGQYLVKHGILNEDELERALAAMPMFGGRLAQTLVGLKLLRPVDAVRLLSEQVRHKLVEACAWREGEYEWREGARNPHPAVALHLNSYEVLSQAGKFLAPAELHAWGKRMQSAAPSIACDRAGVLDQFGFHEVVRNHLNEIDGRRRCRELLASMGNFEEREAFLAALCVLARCGFIRFA